MKKRAAADAQGSPFVFVLIVCAIAMRVLKPCVTIQKLKT